MASRRTGGTGGPPGGLLRPAFVAGERLAAADLQAEQSQRAQRLRRHNRALHGSGIVCGLGVLGAGDPSRPWAVWICPGYAIGPYGDEIVVPERVVFDIDRASWKVGPAAESSVAHVVIASSTEEKRPRRLPVRGRPDERFATRQADGYTIDALWRLEGEAAPEVDLCRRPVPPCSTCPESRYLVLASVHVPRKGVVIENHHIKPWK